MSGNAEEEKKGTEEVKAAEIKEGDKADTLAGDRELQISAEGEQADKMSLAQQERVQKLLSAETWEGIGVPPHLCKAATEILNFKMPSQIQANSIPLITNEPYPNVVAQAKNGSGKTGAFSTSTLMRVDTGVQGLQVLIMSTTRELTLQTFDIVKKLATYMNELTVAVALPGVDQKELIKKQPHVIVGTLASLKTVMKKMKNTENLKCLVVDEADSFFEQETAMDDLVGMMKGLPETTQKLLFSATFSDQVRDFIQKYLPDNVQISVKAQDLSLNHVKQIVLKSEPNLEGKMKTIASIYEEISSSSSFIFVNTRKFAVSLAKHLNENGHFACILMGGDMSPEERDQTFEKFRNKEFNVLITTNLMARGIDVRFARVVVNVDLPRKFKQKKTDDVKVDAETYIHRVGRTGRFGDPGIAINVVASEDDKQMIEDLEAHYGKKMDEINNVQDLGEEIEKHLSEA